MATTRIMPLHVGKGRTESRAISDVIDYVANPQKTDNGKLITGYACDSRTADAEFLLAKWQYIAATGRVHGADDVIAYHVRQSFRPGEISPEEANRLGVELVHALNVQFPLLHQKHSCQNHGSQCLRYHAVLSASETVSDD